MVTGDYEMGSKPLQTAVAFRVSVRAAKEPLQSLQLEISHARAGSSCDQDP